MRVRLGASRTASAGYLGGSILCASFTIACNEFHPRHLTDVDITKFHLLHNERPYVIAESIRLQPLRLNHK